MMKKKTTHAGFTLLETLVAVSVLMIAITATFTAAQSGLSAAIEAKDQVVAFYLAQEAVWDIRDDF
jgi:type II secretory pathway pseudopilin PulG